MEIRVSVNNLVDLRNVRGLSQGEAADLCGISRVYWTELEAGKRRGSLKKTWLIADAFVLLVARLVLIK